MCSQGREGWWVKMCLEKRQNLKIGIRTGLKWPNEQFHVALLQSELGLWHIGASRRNVSKWINKIASISACTYVLYVKMYFFPVFSCSSCSHSQQSTSFIIFFLLILLPIHLHLFSVFAEALHRSSLRCRSIHLTKHNCHPELIAYISKIICQTAASSIT